MEVIATGIPGLVSLKLDLHKDERGFFVETWREEWAGKLKLEHPFIQDNHAKSAQRGVLRGLHFQLPPHTQSKLVWATRGAVYDAAVDLRIGSPTYGQWHGLVLSEENMVRFFIPAGFAHGYMALEPDTEIQYKVDAYYAPQSDGGIRWNDSSLAISWPALTPVLSAKDKELPLIASFDSPFNYRKKQ